VAYPKKDITAIKNKNTDDLKKIIQTYLEKIVVFETPFPIIAKASTRNG